MALGAAIGAWGRPGCPGRRTRRGRDDQPGTVEMEGDRAMGGPGGLVHLLPQQAEQLAGPPRGVMVPRLEHGTHELRGRRRR